VHVLPKARRKQRQQRGGTREQNCTDLGEGKKLETTGFVPIFFSLYVQ
jgi:hypothetical protein